jgi:hypothetical protein
MLCQRSTKLCVWSLILSYDRSSQDPMQVLGLGRGGFCNCGDEWLDSIKMWCCTEHNIYHICSKINRKVQSDIQ